MKNWKKRMGCFVMTVGLAISMVMPAGAVATESFTDLDGQHWAYYYLSKCVEWGVMKGTGKGTIEPSMTLSWGQYLTMLCRALAQEDYQQVLNRGQAWDQAAYTTACEVGLLVEDDFLSVTSDTLGEPLTRKDAAVLLERALVGETELSQDSDDVWDDDSSWSSELVGESTRSTWISFDGGNTWVFIEEDDFFDFEFEEKEEDESESYVLTDLEQMDSNYRTAVEHLIHLGLINGKSDHTFGSDDYLQRADGSTLLVRGIEYIDRMNQNKEKQISISFVDSAMQPVGSEIQVATQIGITNYELCNEYAPENYVFCDEYTQVSTASSKCTIQVRKLSEAEAQLNVARKQAERGEITWEEYYSNDAWLRMQGESTQKHLYLFGSEEKRRFDNQAEAKAAMTVVTVPIWKLSNGVKTESTASFSIHAALAEDVVNIFTEIFNDPEQFPINSVGGYNWRGDTAKGEHNCGTAIDINPNENYQIRYGCVETGSLWEPGVNAYSIAEESSVVRIFEKYGWSWGGTAWASNADPSNGYHDYMHFSYMGK